MYNNLDSLTLKVLYSFDWHKKGLSERILAELAPKITLLTWLSMNFNYLVTPIWIFFFNCIIYVAKFVCIQEIRISPVLTPSFIIFTHEPWHLGSMSNMSKPSQSRSFSTYPLCMLLVLTVNRVLSLWSSKPSINALPS